MNAGNIHSATLRTGAIVTRAQPEVPVAQAANEAWATAYIEQAMLARGTGPFLAPESNTPAPPPELDATRPDGAARAIWALGFAIELAAHTRTRRWASRAFDSLLVDARASTAPCPIALAMLGAAARVRHDPLHSPSRELLEEGGQFLALLLDEPRRPDWAWFEAVPGHEHARLPQALIQAGKVLGRDDWLGIGIRTLDWIVPRQLCANGDFLPVGQRTPPDGSNRGFYCRQSIEVQATIEAARAAFSATGAVRWRTHARSAWRWFFSDSARACDFAAIASGQRSDLALGGSPRNLLEAEAHIAFRLAHFAIMALETALPADAVQPQDPVFPFTAQ